MHRSTRQAGGGADLDAVELAIGSAERFHRRASGSAGHERKLVLQVPHEAIT